MSSAPPELNHQFILFYRKNSKTQDLKCKYLQLFKIGSEKYEQNPTFPTGDHSVSKTESGSGFYQTAVNSAPNTSSTLLFVCVWKSRIVPKASASSRSSGGNSHRCFYTWIHHTHTQTLTELSVVFNSCVCCPQENPSGRKKRGSSAFIASLVTLAVSAESWPELWGAFDLCNLCERLHVWRWSRVLSSTCCTVSTHTHTASLPLCPLPVLGRLWLRR